MQLAELGEQRFQLDAAVSGRVRLQPAHAFASCRSVPILRPRPAWYHATATCTRPWKKSRSSGRGAPRVLELLVRGKVLAGPDQLNARLECGLETVLHSGDPIQGLESARPGAIPSAVATILLCGVDVYFRGKLEALLPGHHFVTTDSADWPDLVIADISRVDPIDVADSYPEIPILGFGGHTDTAGLRRAHEAGFDQVLVKNALQERAAQVVDELIA